VSWFRRPESGAFSRSAPQGSRRRTGHCAGDIPDGLASRCWPDPSGARGCIRGWSPHRSRCWRCARHSCPSPIPVRSLQCGPRRVSEFPNVRCVIIEFCEVWTGVHCLRQPVPERSVIRRYHCLRESMMKRIALFLATNLAIVIVLSISLRLLGVDSCLNSRAGG